MNDLHGPSLFDTHGILIVGCRDEVTLYRDGTESEYHLSRAAALEYALPTYAWPGGYPVFYTMPDGGEICPQCIHRFFLEDNWSDTETVRTGQSTPDIHYEGSPIYCDHCNREIESAYGPVEEDDAETA